MVANGDLGGQSAGNIVLGRDLRDEGAVLMTFGGNVRTGEMLR